MGPLLTWLAAQLGKTTDAKVVTDANGTLSAKLRGLVAILADVWVSASHWLSTSLSGVSACKLQKTYTVAEDVTLTDASTDYPMANAMAAGTKYLCVYCASAVKVAMGAATSATNGVWVGAGQPTVFPVTVTGTTADDKAHAQSATAGAVVTFTSMRD